MHSYQPYKKVVVSPRMDVYEMIQMNNRDSGSPTPVMAIDCEFVGVGPYNVDHLARISIVNELGKIVYDEYVKPEQKITHYRTSVSGIRRENLIGARSFRQVHSEVATLLKGRVIVGHSLDHDFAVLGLNHPASLTIDTSYIRCLRLAARLSSYRRPSLKLLTEKLLGVKIQNGEHDSVIDARAALGVYQLYEQEIKHELSR